MKKSIYIMALGAFGIITTEFGIIGIMPAIAKHFNVSIDTAGWLLSGFALTIALTGPFSVLLTSKINRKWMMCLVLLTFVASNILSAVSPNFTVLMIARILPAFLHPVFWAVATVAASKQVEPKDAPKAVSVVLGGLSVATVLGVPITTYISELINWQASFYVSGVINLIAFAALLAFVPSMPVTEKQSVKSQLVILKKGQMWVNLVATMIMIAGIFATYSFLAEYLGKISSMDGTQISIMLLLFGATGIAGNWVTGIALSKNVMLTTRFFLLSLVGIHLLAYTFGGLFIPMTAIVGIWGFIHTGGFLIGQTRSTSEAPEAPELAASLMVSFGNAGVSLGTFLGGLVIKSFGVHHVIWISILLLLVALALTYVYVGRRSAVTEKEREQEADEPVLVPEEAVLEL
ncbi:MFS transporter [Niastella populi]|uniref:MFS transporter n=1 Tax=Niastella populi TaxID=550983 RepID=A0A1V9GCZ6_9BACT|nr:MFS transporter [Niastella populi]OQP68444.1 MFS transporter [Niastella populi]